MPTDATVVRFARDGSRDGHELSKDCEYQITVDDGPWEVIRSPWDQEELDEIVDVLRNTDSERKPEIDLLFELGRRLGESLSEAPTLVARLQAGRGKRRVVFWQLDYPELARLPWELTCWWTAPHHHILLEPDVTFVRTIPLYHAHAPTRWPTGSDHTMRMLFAWGETPGSAVPHEEHRSMLAGCCERLGVDFIAQEVRDAGELSELSADESFDFVHLLAHGVSTGKGEGGLRFADENVGGEQLARAIQSGKSPPAMVTLAACDSANESNDSFGSVAYHLHAHGIPMVLGSQFRLRKTVSTTSSARVYEALFAGRHPFEVLSNLRRQLAPANNEAWSNEVLYMNYPLEVLDTGAFVGRQQGALRRARSIARMHANSSADRESADRAIADLEEEVETLRELTTVNVNRPETYGLLGSMTRRIAYLRRDPADAEELREARDFYLAGMQADANSLYCGINAVHLSLVIGDTESADQLLPIVTFVSDNLLESDSSDYWAWASAGEVAVYAGNSAVAAAHYREFLKRERHAVSDRRIQAEEIEAASRQLGQLLAALAARHPARSGGDDPVAVAAQSALEILHNSLNRVEGVEMRS